MQLQHCETLAALHQQSQAWLLPNAWDVGSAIILAELGFPAVATSSAALAHSLGRADGEITLDDKLAHCRALASRLSVPISVDFEDGFADAPEGVAQNIVALAETGVAGCSIEDFSRIGQQIFDRSLAEERMQAAVEAVRSLSVPFQLVARSENLIRGRDDLADTLTRLVAFERAGADVLYAPGLKTLDQLRELRTATRKPLNVLLPFFPGVPVADLAAAGANRLSLGNALHASMDQALKRAGQALLTDQCFPAPG